MSKRLLAIIGAAVLVGAIGLFVIGTTLAQGPTSTPSATPPANAAPSAGAKPRAGGWGWGRFGFGGLGGVSDAVTKLLGMTRQQIASERAAGKTLSQIAKEKGFSDQQVIDAIVAAEKTALDQAVKDGKLTQTQADWLLARAKALAPFELSNPFTPGARPAGKHPGWQGRRGCGCRPGRWGKATPTPTAQPS